MKLIFLLKPLIILFALVKANNVYISMNGNDCGDCTVEPCKSVGYLFNHFSGDEVFIHMSGNITFPADYLFTKSNTIHFVGNTTADESFVTEIQFMGSVHPLSLLSISDVIVGIFYDSPIFLKYSDGIAEVTNTLVVPVFGALDFNKPLMYVDGFGILKIDRLIVSNFTCTSMNGLIFLNNDAECRIRNSAINPFSFTSDALIKIFGNSRISILYSTFHLLSSTHAVSSAIFIDTLSSDEFEFFQLNLNWKLFGCNGLDGCTDRRCSLARKKFASIYYGERDVIGDFLVYAQAALDKKLENCENLRDANDIEKYCEPTNTSFNRDKCCTDDVIKAFVDIRTKSEYMDRLQVQMIEANNQMKAFCEK